VIALTAAGAALGASAAVVLHPGQSKKVGGYVVTCSKTKLPTTKGRISLKPGLQVRVGGVLVQCKTAANPAPPPTPTPIAPPPALGTRTNPYPLGTSVTVPDWSIKVNSVMFDAWPQIEAANEFNDPPASGWEDVLVNVTMTYTGTSTGTPWLDFEMNYLGPSNVAYPTSGFDHYCGVSPSPELTDYNSVFTSGAVTGNTCFQIQTSDEAGLVGYWNNFGSVGPWFALR
jgi:hypothetical protein